MSIKRGYRLFFCIIFVLLLIGFVSAVFSSITGFASSTGNINFTILPYAPPPMMNVSLFGVYEPLCCAGGLTGEACLGTYNNITGEGDLYCSDNSSVENFVLHTLYIKITNITANSNDSVGCYIRTSDDSVFFLNKTGLTLNNENYTLNYTFSKDDETSGRINETGAGVIIPWYVDNCSVLNSTGKVLSVKNVSRRVYVHPSRIWDETDLTLAVGCESGAHNLFNNTAKCKRDNTTNAIGSSKEFEFAFKRYAQSGVEANCYDLSPAGNDPTLADENDSTCQTWWDNYTTPEFYDSYDYETRNSLTGFATGGRYHVQDTASNLETVTLLSGNEQARFTSTLYTNTGTGELKTRIRSASPRTNLQYVLAIKNLPMQTNSYNIIGKGLPSNPSSYIVGLTEDSGTKTFSLTCSSSDCETTSPFDIVVVFSFNESLSESRQLTYEIAWTTGGSGTGTQNIQFGTAGLSNDNESETQASIGVNSCKDNENNDLDISTDYSYINGLSPFNQIGFSRDCADEDCAGSQGPSYTPEQDISFSQGNCEYKTELNCTDGYDNDFNDNYSTDAYGMQGIYYTDCHDSDCFGNDSKGCPSSETICNDSINNDWDYVDTDSESSSGHKIGNTDNSGGTSWNNLKYVFGSRTAKLMDCEDPDCNGLIGGSSGEICEWSHEKNCSDGFNNDALQTADCNFNGLFYGVKNNQAPSYSHAEYDCADYCRNNFNNKENGSMCDDGLDNDWDYYDNSSIFSGNTNSSGGIDCGWNGTGGNYNPDPDCNLEIMSNNKRCELGNELTCNDSFDNDYDNGHTTKAGWNSDLYNEYFSQFGMSYSSDADCDDYDCQGIGNCPVSEHPSSAYDKWCFDGADNDLDGKIDCSDSDCSGVRNPDNPIEVCMNYELNASLLLDSDPDTTSYSFCGDNIDNENKDDDNLASPVFDYNSFGFYYTGDRKNKMDCNDADCRQEFGQCGPCSSNELVVWDSCFDNIDNDMDGNIDSLDSDCNNQIIDDRGYNSSGLPLTETSCMNQFDDDKDGSTDCRDSNCTGKLKSPDGRVCGSLGSENCTDDFDNDNDGNIDCYDSDCSSFCNYSVISGQGIIYSPKNSSSVIVENKIRLSYPEIIRKGNSFVVVITYLDSQSSSDTSTITIGSQSNPIPRDAFNATKSYCINCSDYGLTFDKSQASSDSILSVKNSGGLSIPSGVSVSVVVNSTGNVLNSTDVKYSAQFSGTPGDYLKSVEVVNNESPSISVLKLEPSEGELTTSDKLQIATGNFTGVSGGQSHSGKAGRCRIQVSGPNAFNIDEYSNNCKSSDSSNYEIDTSGIYSVNVTIYDSTGNKGNTLSDNLFLNVAPKISLGLSRTNEKRVFFASENSNYDSLSDSYNDVSGIMTAMFTTDSNHPYNSSACSATIRDINNNIVLVSNIPGNLIDNGKSITCNVNLDISSLSSDGLYRISVNATDSQGESLETSSLVFFNCNSLSSSGNGWNCSLADFDVDNYTEGIKLPFNYSSGILSCDTCLGVTNLGKDSDGDGLDNACDPVCGDAYKEGNEECDDGNLINGDGCSSSCKIEGGAPPGGGGGAGGGGGGGGAGGGGRAWFSVEPKHFVFNIRQGQVKTREIIIKNNLAIPINISIDYSDFDRFILINKTNFSIAPGEKEKIELELFAAYDEKPDSYFGEIIVTGNGKELAIDTIINVKEKRSLFDIITKMITKIVKPGKNATARINLTNIGDLGPLNATLYYAIKNFENKTLISNKENITIDRTLVLERSLTLPKNASDKNYAFYSQIKYEESIATSADIFTTSQAGKWILFIIILLILALIIILIIVLYKRRKKKNLLEV